MQVRLNLARQLHECSSHVLGRGETTTVTALGKDGSLARPTMYQTDEDSALARKRDEQFFFQLTHIASLTLAPRLSRASMDELCRIVPSDSLQIESDTTGNLHVKGTAAPSYQRCIMLTLV